MTVLYLIATIAVLILVHEFGHFLAAKKFGVFVREFGFGLPPKFLWKKIGETIYSLNILPFGGFVRMAGEGEDEEKPAPKGRSFEDKNRFVQGFIISAGVLSNLVLAWFIISAGLMSGMPSAIDGQRLNNPPADTELTILEVVPDSPADKAGFLSGDQILFLGKDSRKLQPEPSADRKTFISPEEARAFITESMPGEEISAIVKRGGENVTVFVRTEAGAVVEGNSGIGVALEAVGTLKLSLISSIAEGAKRTALLTVRVGEGLAEFFYNAVRGEASLKSVSGPVGIGKMVKEAGETGFKNLAMLVALLSIHLAVLNILPFPALDGGRLLMIVIEAVRRRPINRALANKINIIGFFLLIVLMIVVTYNDLLKLFK